MIDKLTYVESNNYDPHMNLAMEEHLLLHVQQREVILYLWQNSNTVVIGRNQNARKECRLSELEASGGRLARRLSGGGAVYHDLGNLNFTFFAQGDNYSIDKQLSVIIEALAGLGIKAEKTGRNDVLVDGRKVSGNAFYKTGDSHYHHGTLMVNVDKDALTKYLNVSELKLKGKGVDSVRSRVANLSEYAELSTESLKNALLEAFEKLYGGRAERKIFTGEEMAQISEAAVKMSSTEWLFGEEAPCTHSIEDRMPWGVTGIDMNVRKGRVVSAKIYTDALDVDVPKEIENAIIGMWHEDVIKAVESGDYEKLRSADAKER